MGGRGARSGGRSGRAPNGYYTAGKVGRIKVIRDNVTKKGLPTKVHIKNAKFFGTDGSGKINQMRIFDKHGNASKDIDWTHNFRIDGKSYPKGTVRFHSWKNGRRVDDHKLPTPSQRKQYKPNIDKLIDAATNWACHDCNFAMQPAWFSVREGYRSSYLERKAAPGRCECNRFAAREMRALSRVDFQGQYSYCP